jgi:hypothetical protein
LRDWKMKITTTAPTQVPRTPAGKVEVDSSLRLLPLNTRIPI